MKTLLTLATLTLCSLASNAAPASDESIRTLFQVMKAEALMDSVYANMELAMRQFMAQAMGGKSLSDEQRRIMSLAPQRMSEVIRSELSWAKMEPMQVSVYRETFEQPEIDGLIEFYRSPVGQAFVNKMPTVTQKGAVAMQGYMQQVMPRIKAAMDEILKEARLAPGQ